MLVCYPRDVSLAKGGGGRFREKEYKMDGGSSLRISQK